MLLFSTKKIIFGDYVQETLSNRTIRLYDSKGACIKKIYPTKNTFEKEERLEKEELLVKRSQLEAKVNTELDICEAIADDFARHGFKNS